MYRTYADDAHLNPEDEAKVRDLLEYHPNAQEKTGSGIDFIKVVRSQQLSVLQSLSDNWIEQLGLWKLQTCN